VLRISTASRGETTARQQHGRRVVAGVQPRQISGVARLSAKRSRRSSDVHHQASNMFARECVVRQSQVHVGRNGTPYAGEQRTAAGVRGSASGIATAPYPACHERQRMSVADASPTSQPRLNRRKRVRRASADSRRHSGPCRYPARQGRHARSQTW